MEPEFQYAEWPQEPPCSPELDFIGADHLPGTLINNPYVRGTYKQPNTPYFSYLFSQ
jgi:hypothetical protein